MSKLIIATNNPGKAKEFELLFADFDETVLSLKDLPESIDVKETGTTFHENAKLKAEAVSSLTGETVISDDSGLMIDALDGRPGVYSARFAGSEKNDQANIEKVLSLMKHVPEADRRAQFVTVLAISMPGSETRYIEGKCEGVISETLQGKGGFGYDPIFYVPEKNKTFAEMSQEEKNEISHRGKAMKQLKANWAEWQGEQK